MSFHRFVAAAAFAAIAAVGHAQSGPAPAATAAPSPAPTVAAMAGAAAAPAIAAASYILVDWTSGQTIVAQNVDERRDPASLTKLMTAYLTFAR